MLSNFWIQGGSKLPMYCFNKNVKERECSSTFLDLLFKEWEERKSRGLFHHDISSCETKVLPGEFKFITTLVEGRDQKKRPTEFKIDEVLQPFKKEKFNFTKVGQEELIFRFEDSEKSDDQCTWNAILINVSPIGYGHVLLIPRILDYLPQRIDRESFMLALYMANEASNPYFRVGYNSLGGFATINHLHFQAFYLDVEFPVEKAPTQKISTLHNTVSISQLLNYPVWGLVFELGRDLEDLCNVVSFACILLQESNKPFNVLISASGKRIFLLLQCYAQKLSLGNVNQEIIDMRVNPAVWELSGHVVLKSRKHYEESSETTVRKFLTEASLTEDQFKEDKKYILDSLLQFF